MLPRHAILIIVKIVLALAGVTIIHCGVITNESISVSSSSSSSSKTGLAKKPSKVAKVLYTAPYSHVRISQSDGPMPSLSGTPKKYKMAHGPVLVKKGTQDVTTTTAPTTTEAPLVLLDVVTEPEESSVEAGITTTAASQA